MTGDIKSILASLQTQLINLDAEIESVIQRRVDIEVSDRLSRIDTLVKRFDTELENIEDAVSSLKDISVDISSETNP